MCPVDYVADAICDIASRTTSFSEGVFHIWNPHGFRFDDMFAYLSRHGYKVQPTEYIHWRTALMDLTLDPKTSSDDQHALFPLLHFVLDDLPTSTRSPELDDSNTRRAISDQKGTPCPDVRELMGLYLGYFVEIGFLEKPVVEGGDVVGLPLLESWKVLKGMGAVTRSGA
ncbi:large subunit of alpha-aminoadipate reductase [Blyttiomyces sp. JEL0837]|nr:large subunit of alpha-aminoadipate reductase [Blyttiomyces sp. JEL0837]